MSTQAPPKILEDIFEKIIGPIIATQVGPFLEERDHIEDRVQVLKGAFETYPNFRPPFQTLVLSISHQEEVNTIEEQIRFFQTKHTRYWLMVCLANRILKLKDLKLNTFTGRFPAKAHDLLKFSHQGRLTLGEESRYKDVLTAVGFMFDMVFYMQRNGTFNLPKRYDDEFSKAFEKAMGQAKMAVTLNMYKPNLEYERIIPVMPFMRQLAQLCICMVEPEKGWEFYKGLENPTKPKPSEPLKMALEMRAFGVTTAMVAGALAECFDIFEKLGECMSIWGFPYLSHSRSKAGIEEACAMGMLAVAASERLRADDFRKSPLVKLVMPELKYLDFNYSKEVITQTQI